MVHHLPRIEAGVYTKMSRLKLPESQANSDLKGTAKGPWPGYFGGFRFLDR